MNFNFTPGNSDNRKPLDAYARNLTDDVIKGKIDPVIGRDEEIRRLIEIISRKTKNNPVLIGEPGVGKTAIVEGFAHRIINGDVPQNLKDKEIYEISLSSLIAGASFQGEFEKRLEGIIKQAQESEGKIILFIDEIHQLVGMGKNQGAMDAANILKPAMARGGLKIIGATTLNEYRQYIEKDGALERRMQKVFVSEPSVQEALTIMRGLKEKWELFHQVKIHDNALVSAVMLSDRYITDKFLPDKAIDLIDEAAAKVKTEMHSLPVELDKIYRQIIHKETERASLLNETDSASKQKMEEINNELIELKKTKASEEEIWKKHKDEHELLIKMKKELETNKTKIERLQLEGQYEKASKLLYVEVPKLEIKINELETKITSQASNFRDSVTSNEVAEVISKATGIKITKLLESEKVKILNLSNDLKFRVKGQDEAIKVVSDTVLRSKAGINDPKRPIGTFLFLGPTGVGKTELAKALSYNMFDSEKTMIRIDCSELMEEHSISKLIGSPAGYIGYGDANILAEPVRRRPYSIVLFDEIEKAHPKVLTILLQILDEGVLHDSQGNNVNFKNTIIIMTSNIGSVEIFEGKKKEAIESLKKYLRPEFINRIDEIVTFTPISKTAVKEIVLKMLDELSQRLSKEGYDIKMDDKRLIDFIIEESFDENFGARPIKRFIQKTIENYLANQILLNNVKKNHPYAISVNSKKEITTKVISID